MLHYNRLTTPFDRCDRVEDYKGAWKHFEEIFEAEKPKALAITK